MHKRLMRVHASPYGGSVSRAHRALPRDNPFQRLRPAALLRCIVRIAPPYRPGLNAFQYRSRSGSVFTSQSASYGDISTKPLCGLSYVCHQRSCLLPVRQLQTGEPVVLEQQRHIAIQSVRRLVDKLDKRRTDILIAYVKRWV
jgi:hypothetical protein